MANGIALAKMGETNNHSDESTLLILTTRHDNESGTTSSSTPINNDTFSLYHEAKTLAAIAFPTIIVQLSTYCIYPQCASAVGRQLDTESLAAFSLGSVSGNMTCISIIIGTLSASETLQPRAFGLKRYREVGRLAIRGFFMCLLSLIIPVVVLLTRADEIFDGLGQDVDAGYLASEWIKVYIWSVPPVLLFRVTQRYLACQNIVIPCAFGAVIGCFVVHPFVLKWAIQKYGFLGSSWAIVITQFVQFLLCIGFVVVTGSYEKMTWPGLSPSIMLEALDVRELLSYAKLSIGGIFALSEWWFWECICFLAGRFGLVELCVHTVTYQLIPITFMVPLGISIGLSVRMGVLLPVSVDGAKRLAAVTMLFTICAGITISAVIYKYQTWIVSMFTSDEEVFEGCQRIWFQLCVYLVLLWIFCVSGGILSALGLQWRTAANMFIVLWVWTIPAIIYSCIYDGKGYYHMWKILPLSYIVLDIGLTITYLTADWEGIGAKIKLDRKVKEVEQEEQVNPERILDI